MKAVDKAYCAVRDGILSNKFAPGVRITEQEISILSGVSRTPVREALRRLQSEGLVTVQPNQGAIVTPVSPESANEIYELRALLECEAVRKASLRATDEELAELRQLASQQWEEAYSEAPDLERIAGLNADFHGAIFRAAHNETLRHVLQSLMDPFLVIRAFRYYSPETLRRSAEQHLDLVAMLEARDADAAAAVMAHHVLSARHVFRKGIDQG